MSHFVWLKKIVRVLMLYFFFSSVANKVNKPTYSVLCYASVTHLYHATIKHVPEQHGSILYHYFYYHYCLSDNFQRRFFFILYMKGLVVRTSCHFVQRCFWKWSVFFVLASLVIIKVCAEIKFSSSFSWWISIGQIPKEIPSIAIIMIFNNWNLLHINSDAVIRPS